MKAINQLFRKAGVPGFSQDTQPQAAEEQAAKPESAAPAERLLQAVARTPETPLRVILFIGHHKVGSTSLQDYLSRNSVALSRAGILYPYVDFEGMAHLAAFATGHVQPAGSLPINVREPHNALAFRMMAELKGRSVPAYHKRLPALAQMVNAINQQIRFSDPHTVILAAEVFANFNEADPELITQLAGYFPGAEFTVVATLRRIDEYLASWHGQRLKFGHKPEPLHGAGTAGYFKGIHFNYRLMAEGWLKALPQAQVILRDYADVRKNGGSVNDFITQTGLQMPDGLASERRENDSIHRGIYEIVRRANAGLPAPVAGRLRNSLRQMTVRLNLPPSHDIELFGADNRARLLEQFQPIDSWLGEVMGTSGFFADLAQISVPGPCAEMEIYREALEQICGIPGWWDNPAEIDFMKTLQAEAASAQT